MIHDFIDSLQIKGAFLVRIYRHDLEQGQGMIDTFAGRRIDSFQRGSFRIGLKDRGGSFD